MTQRFRAANATRRATACQRVLAVLAVALFGLHVVVGAASLHVHADDGDDDACVVCAASSGEDHSVAQAVAPPAASNHDVAAAANCAQLLAPRRPFHLPRGPPALSP